MNMSKQSGYLEIILGPMYASKTTRLIEIYKQCNYCNIPVAVINHSIDNRYDNELLSSHDKIKIPCIKTDKLLDVWDNNISLEGSIYEIPRFEDKFKISSSKVILINEGQFFPDLYEFVVHLLNNKKEVYVCGLDGDFERKKFGQILDLVPLCDKVEKLTSLCSLCKNGTKGIFSMRLTNETTQTLVGSENYIPVCRDCYSKNYHCQEKPNSITENTNSITENINLITENPLKEITTDTTMNIGDEFEKLFPNKKFKDLLEQTNDVVAYCPAIYYKSKYDTYRGTTTPIIYSYSKHHTKIPVQNKNVRDIPPDWVEFSPYMLLDDFKEDKSKKPPLWLMLDLKEAISICKMLKFPTY